MRPPFPRAIMARAAERAHRNVPVEIYPQDPLPRLERHLDHRMLLFDARVTYEYVNTSKSLDGHRDESVNIMLDSHVGAGQDPLSANSVDRGQ